MTRHALGQFFFLFLLAKDEIKTGVFDIQLCATFQSFEHAL